MEELKSCPFCGSEADIDIIGYDDGRFTVDCSNDNCIASKFGFKHFKDGKDAVEAWNKRISTKS